MNNACRSDDFVSRIAVEIKMTNRSADVYCQRPNLDACDQADQVRAIQINFNSATLRELGDFPDNNC